MQEWRGNSSFSSFYGFAIRFTAKLLTQSDAYRQVNPSTCVGSSSPEEKHSAAFFAEIPPKVGRSEGNEQGEGRDPGRG